MPGVIRVSVIELVDLPSSSTSALLTSVGNNPFSVKVALGKNEFQPQDEGYFSLPLTTFRENVIVSVLDSEGNLLSKTDVKTMSVVEKGTWDDFFPLQCGGYIHMKLQFILNEEERRRVHDVRESVAKRKYDEILKNRVVYSAMDNISQLKAVKSISEDLTNEGGEKSPTTFLQEPKELNIVSPQSERKLRSISEINQISSFGMSDLESRSTMSVLSEHVSENRHLIEGSKSFDTYDRRESFDVIQYPKLEHTLYFPSENVSTSFLHESRRHYSLEEISTVNLRDLDTSLTERNHQFEAQVGRNASEKNQSSIKNIISAFENSLVQGLRSNTSSPVKSLVKDSLKDTLIEIGAKKYGSVLDNKNMPSPAGSSLEVKSSQNLKDEVPIPHIRSEQIEGRDHFSVNVESMSGVTESEKGQSNTSVSEGQAENQNRQSNTSDKVISSPQPQENYSAEDNDLVGKRDFYDEMYLEGTLEDQSCRSTQSINLMENENIINGESSSLQTRDMEDEPSIYREIDEWLKLEDLLSSSFSDQEISSDMNLKVEELESCRESMQGSFFSESYRILGSGMILSNTDTHLCVTTNNVELMDPAKDDVNQVDASAAKINESEDETFAKDDVNQVDASAAKINESEDETFAKDVRHHDGSLVDKDEKTHHSSRKSWLNNLIGMFNINGPFFDQAIKVFVIAACGAILISGRQRNR